MSGKLSEKFANLGASNKEKSVRANSRNNVSTVSDRIREARANNRAVSQKSQRQAQTQQRRTGVVATANNNKPRLSNGPRTNVKGKGVIVRGTLAFFENWAVSMEDPRIRPASTSLVE
ncbi:hypothetical protein EON63_17425 [archaeon]|nr:MAG: hypothetical protein EON63_17425 [archaeon]